MLTMKNVKVGDTIVWYDERNFPFIVKITEIVNSKFFWAVVINVQLESDKKLKGFTYKFTFNADWQFLKDLKRLQDLQDLI